MSHEFQICCPEVLVFNICLASQGGSHGRLCGNSAEMTNPLCTQQEAASIRASSNIQLEFPLDVCSIFYVCLCLFLRCVCSSASLRLPAVPEGQTHPAGVSDAFLPRDLSRCLHCLPHSHLSHLHRFVFKLISFIKS